MSAPNAEDVPPPPGPAGIPLLRLGAVTAFEQAVREVAAALRCVDRTGGRELLVCAREVLFSAPSLPARHAMVRSWAEAAAGRVRVVIMVGPELVDPERFGVVAAANFGLAGWVCSEEDEALAWLGRVAAGHTLQAGTDLP